MASHHSPCAQSAISQTALSALASRHRGGPDYPRQAQSCRAHWQRLYSLDKPITVDANDEIHVDCTFDTTTRKEAVEWGEGTQDQMSVVGLFVKL